MLVQRSIDVEDEVRKALSPYFKIYVRPLPATFDVPSLLVTLVGGTEAASIDGTDVVIDARAQTDAEALDLLLDAVATLKEVAHSQSTLLRYVVLNTSASWGSDPVRPDLSLCTARLRIYTHKIEKNIQTLT